MTTRRLSVLWAVALCVSAVALPSIAVADTDASTMLTPAEIGSAVGVAVAGGSHVTATFVKKQITAARMAAGADGTSIKPVAVGEDGYYFVAGDQVGLLVKKGALSFKVTVYATLPVDKKEAMKLTLAKAVVAKL